MTRETARMHQPGFLRRLLVVPILVLSFFVGTLPAQASNSISSTASGKSNGSYVTPPGSSNGPPAGAGSGHRIRSATALAHAFADEVP